MATTKQKRGALSRSASKRVTVPIPRSWESSIETAVRNEDSDFSKITRNALRHHFQERFGINLPTA